jgi:uncharacterized protein (TIGR00645 family)
MTQMTHPTMTGTSSSGTSSLATATSTSGSLALIDLSLAGNLLVIVIFSGYENFVSKFDLKDHEDAPEWKGTVDFSTLKLKLIASILEN